MFEPEKFWYVFFMGLVFLIACTEKNSSKTGSAVISDNVLYHDNIFDSSNGFWVNYKGTILCRECKESPVRLSFFVSPFTNKMKYKLVLASKNGNNKIAEGNYVTFGRHIKKKYQSVFQFIVNDEKREDLFFVRADDFTLRQLTNEKTEFPIAKKYFLKKIN